MVRYVVTFTSLLLVLIPTVSALRIPVPRHPDIACAPPQTLSLGPGGIPICSLNAKTAGPTAQTLERRAPAPPNSRKARARARVQKGKPPATPAEKGRGTGNPRVKPPMGPMSPKKQAKVAERKENRNLGKKQKQAAKVAEAFQKQRPPPYGIDPNTGALRRPEQGDVTNKVWADKQKVQRDKQKHTAAYHALSPADKAAQDAATAANQAATRQQHITDNTKEINRQNRIRTKAADRAARKADNRRDATTAKAAFTSAQGLPQRSATYTSPQGRPYTGKDVRQGVFSAEFATAKGGVGYNALVGKASKNRDKLPKKFQNRPNSDGTIPLPGAQPMPGNPLMEFPMNHDKKMGYDGRKPAPTEARIVTQQNAAGQTELKGLIGHPTGSNDHISF